MIVGIDGGALCVSDDRLKVGVYKITQRLISYIDNNVDSNNYRIYIFNKIGESHNLHNQRVKYRLVSPTKFWHKIWMPYELIRQPVDVYLGISQSIPNLSFYTNIKRRKIYTKFIGFIYDLGFLHYKELYPGSNQNLIKQTEYLVRNSHHIITISEFTKKDICNTYGVSPDKITVSYPGVDQMFKKQTKHLEKTVIGDKYFLFVGALKPGKNLPTALEAFSKVYAINSEYKFKVVGGDYWRDPKIDIALKKYGLGKEVEFLGHINDAVLPRLYKNAICLVSPSFWEGFGIHVAESMAMGTPVIVSNRGSLPEVVHKSGVIIDPLDVSNISKAMLKLATNYDYRGDLSKKSKIRAQEFTWESFAQKVLQVINNV